MKLRRNVEFNYFFLFLNVMITMSVLLQMVTQSVNFSVFYFILMQETNMDLELFIVHCTKNLSKLDHIQSMIVINNAFIS